MNHQFTLLKLAPIALGCVISLNVNAATPLTLFDNDGDGVISAW